ncbi:MAG TPA: DUF692 domain-containing protein [Casimicrobiaceae bacterium]|nr:DUF692 domain-containing protein [Casimicrobiaceae bacterium]
MRPAVSSPSVDRAVRADAGIGLRSPHVRKVRSERPPLRWLEVHSENYFADGGPALATLDDLRTDYALSLHGVGMSLGSVDPLDRAHLAKLKRLADRVEPAFVSEHLCWSGVGGRHFNDLLPLPYTEEALTHVATRVGEVQDALGREILVENVSTYLAFAEATIPEWEFVAELARRSGCRLLLDVNNIYVNATNHGFDADRYVAAIPADKVGEIHLAGFEASGPYLIDTHGAPVAPDVWALFERTIARFGPRPTLIEWDLDIPPFEVLEREAATAQAILDKSHVHAR